MKQSKYITTAFIIALMFSVSSCNNGTTGKYTSLRNTNDYIQLKSDGTFHLRENFRDGAGKYEVDGSNVYFTLDSGKSFKCKLEGRILKHYEMGRGNAWAKYK